MRLLSTTLLCALVAAQASAQTAVSKQLLELDHDERNAAFTLMLRDSRKCDQVVRKSCPVNREHALDTPLLQTGPLPNEGHLSRLSATPQVPALLSLNPAAGRLVLAARPAQQLPACRQQITATHERDHRLIRFCKDTK
jgi:hypothetical protein